MSRTIAMVVAVVVAVVIGPAVGWGAMPAAESTPDAQGEPGEVFEGVVADASRGFLCVRPAFPPGLVRFNFLALRFDSERHAGRYARMFRSGLSGDGFGDYSLIVRGVLAEWFTAEASVDGSTYEVGALLLSDGVDLHFWLAVGATGSPRDDLGTIADGFLDDDLRPAGVPATAPLLDRLPGADDMPRGCVLTGEGTDDLVGEGTPMASTPVPEPSSTCRWGSMGAVG